MSNGLQLSTFIIVQLFLPFSTLDIFVRSQEVISATFVQKSASSNYLIKIQFFKMKTDNADFWMEATKKTTDNICLPFNFVTYLVKSNKVMKNDCWIWSVRTTNNLPISNNGLPPPPPHLPSYSSTKTGSKGSRRFKEPEIIFCDVFERDRFSFSHIC